MTNGERREEYSFRIALIVFFLVTLKASADDALDGKDALASNTPRGDGKVDAMDELLGITVKKEASLSLQERPREGRGADRDSTSGLVQKSPNRVVGGPRGLTHSAPVTFGNFGDELLKDESMNEKTTKENESLKKNVTTAEKDKEFSQPLYEKKYRRFKSSHGKSSPRGSVEKSSTTPGPGPIANSNVEIWKLSLPIGSSARKKNTPSQPKHQDLPANHRDTAATSVVQPYGMRFLNTSASESSRSRTNSKQEVAHDDHGRQHRTAIHGTAIHPRPTGHLRTTPAGLNAPPQQAQRPHHSAAVIRQDFAEQRVPAFSSTAAGGQYDPVQGNSITGGLPYGHTHAGHFVNPGYPIDHQGVRGDGGGHPLPSPPAVRPISHGTTLQETLFETLPANSGSLYAQGQPQIQNSNAFSIGSMELGQGGYRARSPGNLYGGLESNYGGMFGQPAPNFGLPSQAGSGGSAGFLGAQQDYFIPGRMYNQPIKQGLDDYGDQFNLNNGHNMNFVVGGNEFGGLGGRRQYLSAANGELEQPFGGGFHNSQTGYRANLAEDPFVYNGAGDNNHLGLRGMTGPFVEPQGGPVVSDDVVGRLQHFGQQANDMRAGHNPIVRPPDSAMFAQNNLAIGAHQRAPVQMSPNQVSHLSIPRGSPGDSRPYAILPGGNFHAAQGAPSKSSSAPNLSRQVKAHQRPRCATASDAKSQNATYCTEDENYPRESVVQSAFLDPLTARRLVPHIRDEQLVFAESNDIFAVDLMEAQESVNDHSGRKNNGHVKQNQQKDSSSGKTELLRKACSSEVATIRPLRARNTRGDWKVIVNVDTPQNGQKYTQLVRIDTCRRPSLSCSHVSPSVQRSACSQKFTTHRLAAWSRDEGLHMDAFRFPVACSCLVVTAS